MIQWDAMIRATVFPRFIPETEAWLVASNSNLTYMTFWLPHNEG